MSDQDLLIRFPVAERITEIAQDIEQREFWCLAAVLKSFGYPTDLSGVRLENPTPQALAHVLKVLSGNGLHAVPISPNGGVWTVTLLHVLLSKMSRVTTPLVMLGPFAAADEQNPNAPGGGFALVTGFSVTSGKDEINSLELLECKTRLEDEQQEPAEPEFRNPITQHLAFAEAVRILNGVDGKFQGLVMVSSPAHTPDLADRAIASGLGAGWWPGS